MKDSGHIENFLKNVPSIPQDQSYWFIRTDSGMNFEEFVNSKFLGIGWNEITKNDIQTKSAIQVKEKIAKVLELDASIKKNKSAITGIYTKILRFNDLKKGDIVVIPSYASSRLAFGTIGDNSIYTENRKDKIEACSYIKRRRFVLNTIKSLSELDNAFYKIVQSRHAISDIKKYSKYIDSVMKTLFVKESHVHYVMDVKTSNDIDLVALTTLMLAVEEITALIDKEFKLADANEKLSVRLNLQSPGKIEIIKLITNITDVRKIAANSIIILSIILSSCSNGNITPSGNKEVDKFMEVNKPLLQKIDTSIKQLEIDRQKINNR